jgi:hypothetical protein
MGCRARVQASRSYFGQISGRKVPPKRGLLIGILDAHQIAIRAVERERLFKIDQPAELARQSRRRTLSSEL